uniref:Lipogenin n=1 Tax=Rattus norvegicus TaxID=10116 RepID=Q91Z77_RAT|nr:lipogenin [Rattus norvegicus]|eukprot:NP_665733.1 Lipogenin [Rattus norvegicus]
MYSFQTTHHLICSLLNNKLVVALLFGPRSLLPLQLVHKVIGASPTEVWICMGLYSLCGSCTLKLPSVGHHVHSFSWPLEGLTDFGSPCMRPLKRHWEGAGEMAQWLRALTALLEVLSSNPSNHMVANNHL